MQAGAIGYCRPAYAPGVQLIYPERRPSSPEELASGLRLHELAPPERPYLGLNMVSSLDGQLAHARSLE